MGEVLELAGVRKSFGALRVIDDLSLTVAAGELVGVIGPNGAGKTTLLNLVGGDLRAGRGVDPLPRRGDRRGAAARALPQGHRALLPDPAAVRRHDGVREPARRGRRSAAAMPEDAASGACVEVLDRTGLRRHANALAGRLTLLDRKRLELARALATQPQLLLLDEIAGGLTEHEARELVALIREIKAAGTTMVWIEHVMHALVAVADRIVAINFGAKLADGPPDAVMADPEVRRVYLGIEA